MNAEDRNPLIQDKPVETLQRVYCLMTYLDSQELEGDSAYGDDGDWRFGRHLLMQTIQQAVAHARDNISSRGREAPSDE